VLTCWNCSRTTFKTRVPLVSSSESVWPLRLAQVWAQLLGAQRDGGTLQRVYEVLQSLEFSCGDRGLHLPQQPSSALNRETRHEGPGPVLRAPRSRK